MEIEKCRNCNSTEDLYIMPCRHIICSECITPCNRNELACGYCGNHYKKSFVIEYVPENSEESESE